MGNKFVTLDQGLAHLNTSMIEGELASVDLKTYTNQGIAAIAHPNIVFWNDDTYQDFMEQQVMKLCELEQSSRAISLGHRLPNSNYHREYYKLFLQPNLKHTLQTLSKALRALKKSGLQISGKLNYRLPTKGKFEVIVLYAYPRTLYQRQLEILEQEFREDARDYAGPLGVIFTKRVSPLIYVRQGGGLLREEAQREGSLDYYFYGPNHWRIRETAYAKHRKD